MVKGDDRIDLQRIRLLAQKSHVPWPYAVSRQDRWGSLPLSSRGSRHGRFEHVSAGVPDAPEHRHVLCSLHWDWARAAQGPKEQRALGHFFNGRESLRDSWERLCPRALAIRSPPNATHSVIHCCQSSTHLHSCKDKVLHRRFRADADLGGPRPGRLLVHRPGHRQIRVGRLQVDR